MGNSLALRIPRDLARRLSVLEGSSAALSVEAGRLTIAPVEDAPVYTLDELLAGLTDDNPTLRPTLVTP